MKLLSLSATALLLAAAASAQAGVLPAGGTPQTFTLTDGAALPDSLSISAQVNGISTTTGYGISGNAVRLSTFTPPGGTTSTVSRLLLPVLDSTNIVTAFTMNFDLALAAGNSTPAAIGEGFSLNFGTIPGNNGLGEAGFSGMAFGLTISWDTRDNGGQDRALLVYANGTLLGQFPAANFPAAFIIDDTSVAPATFRPVEVRWDDAGLDIKWNNVVICDNLQTPGFSPAANDRFAFSARTSDANEDILIDNLLVNTTAQNPLATGGPVIWEFLARNKDDIEDDENDHPDWIEIYNGQPAAQTMTGWFLTDDPLVPQKWAFPVSSIPANGFTYVFASGKNRTNAAHPHTNFTLPGEGGYIALVRPNGTIASQVTYGPQYDDIPSGFKAITDDLAYLSATSPGKVNTVIPLTSITITKGVDVITEEPVFTTSTGTPLTSGFITANETVVIPPPVTPGAQVRYTTNGTTPTASSTLYTAPIAVTNRSMAIRARVFRPGYVPGPNKTLNLIFRAADLTNYRNTGRPFESNLPVLMMDTFGVDVDSATDPSARVFRYTYGMLFDPASGFTAGKASLSDVPAVASGAGTHVRGQTSAGFPQRPYALEWWNSDDKDKDVPMLGMPADSDWVLYSPYNEETLMRNAVVYNTMYQWAGQGAGMRSRFVEVFFNQASGTMAYADYRGIYLLVEKIKRSPERVDVEKINAEVTDPAFITGGYVWKKDKPPQVQTITTTTTGSWGNQTLEVMEPDIFNTTQQTWLDTYVQNFDTALMNATTWRDPVNGYRKYADTASFADNLLWVEAFKQIDGYRISTYFNKTRTGKITAFPAWDYNLAGGNANYYAGENPTGWYHKHISGDAFPYWPRMLQDADFVTEKWDRFWKARRSVLTTANVNSLIDAFSAQIRNGDARDVRNTSRTVSPPASGPDFDTPASRHFYKNQTLGVYNWPNCNNYAQRLSFQSEVEFFREWMRQRLEWMEYSSMDGSASLTKIRPPNIHDALTKAQTYKARVPEGYQITMADQDGLAGSQIYYTIDGPDPRTAFTSALNPAAVALSGASTAVTTFIANSQPWKYSASLSAYPAVQTTTTWLQSAYDDTAWASGNAPIGYSETGLGTTLTTQVPTAGANQVTCFRKTFTVADPAAIYQFWVELNADDGAVIYVNGQEAVRVNMPYAPVAINFASRATGVTDGVGDGEAENLFIPYRLNPAHLVAGTNTIAVEVHQFQYGSSGNPNSSAVNDMRFDLRLKGSTVTWPTPITLTGTGVHTVRARTRAGTSWSPLSEAEFTVGTEAASAANLVISEMMYNPSPPTAAETTATGALESNAFEYIELMNIGATPVDLSGLAIQNAVQMDFSTVPAASRVLMPGARGLLVSNRTAFLARHPGLESQILGQWTSGNLRNGGEVFTLTTDAGATVIRSFAWDNNSPWPALAGADHLLGDPDYSLVLNQPTTNPDHANPANWRPSGVSGGSPGAADSTTAPADNITDTDGDGLSDFSEWAFGANARPVATIATWQPPVGQPGQYLMVRVPRNGLADGVTYTVQSSTDLQAWASSGFVDAGTDFSGSTEYSVFVSASPVGALPKFYLRAVATKP